MWYIICVKQNLTKCSTRKTTFILKTDVMTKYVRKSQKLAWIILTLSPYQMAIADLSSTRATLSHGIPSDNSSNSSKLYNQLGTWLYNEVSILSSLIGRKRLIDIHRSAKSMKIFTKPVFFLISEAEGKVFHKFLHQFICSKKVQNHLKTGSEIKFHTWFSWHRVPVVKQSSSYRPLMQ